MAEREIVDWFTANGKHIPIHEGESKEDAYKRYNKSVANKNEDTKQKQIAKNKEQADKLNAQKNVQNKPKNTQDKNRNSNAKQNTTKNTQDQKKDPNLYRPGLPRNVQLKNIKAEDVSEKVRILGSSKRIAIKEGTEITKVVAFAGKDCYKVYEKAQNFADKYGGKAEDWQHCAGYAILTNGEKDFVREIHWSQGADGKVVEPFIKYHNKGGKKK